MAPGRVTMFTPNQLMPNSWQLMHFMLVTAVCFIGVPANDAKFAGAWQASHAALLNGMCVGGGALTVTPKNDSPAAWQVEQPEAIPAWFMLVPAKLAKLLAA